MSRGVSVVVPVYNPGEYIERTIESLLTQTLPDELYEVVFVDDGSTDGTGRRLDEVAAAHPHLVRVEHIPNSGWPGRPRNVGTDLARFDYVFYCDADDWLPVDALRLLLDRVEQDGSDLVVSRAIGNRRAVPQVIFERGDFCTTWRETPAVFSNLTIQKLFRREFLRANGIRFSEGKVRLEDFIFMMTAYLRSERISVLGSRPCYVLEKRTDAGNLTATAAETDGYFASVEKILDVVDANTGPGSKDRDVAVDRTLRGEILAPVSGPGFLRKDKAERARMFAHAQRLLRDRVPASAVARLDPFSRRRVRAVIDGDRALVEDWIAWDAALSADIRFTELTWTDEGTLRVALELAFVRAGAVVELTSSDNRWYAPGPPSLHELGVDVSAVARRATVHIALRSRDIHEQWRLRARTEFAPGAEGADRIELRWRAVAEIDFRTLAHDRPLRKQVWDPYVQLNAVGFGRERRAGLADWVAEPPIAVLDEQTVSAYVTRAHELAFDVDGDMRPLAADLVRHGVAPVGVHADALTLGLALRVEGRPPSMGVELVPDGRGARPVELAGTFGPESSTLHIPLPDLGTGRWAVHLRAPDGTAPVGQDLLAESGAPMRVVPGRRRSPSTKAKGDMAEGSRKVGWRRRLVRLAGRAGVTISRVGPNTITVSRTRSHENVLPLGSGVAVVAMSDEPPALRQVPVGANAWVVSATRDGEAASDVARIGTSGAVVSEADLGPRDALVLETNTMKHLGEQHLAWLLDRYRIDCVIDVGANSGQYGRALRRGGFAGHIVSVEPVPEFADKVRELASGDEKWTVAQIALGDAEGVVPIRVQRTFSSALSASEYGKQRFGTLREFADADDHVVEVPLRRLDTVLDEWLAPVIASGAVRPRVFLKMDTQGLDLQVFAGLGERTKDIVGLQSEVALLLIYENMPRMPEALAVYEAAGFEITGLYPVTRELDGRIIEYDCMMVRPSELPTE